MLLARCGNRKEQTSGCKLYYPCKNVILKGNEFKIKLSCYIQIIVLKPAAVMRCVVDVSSWESTYRLKFNMTTKKFLWAREGETNVPIPIYLRQRNSNIGLLRAVVFDLGSKLDVLSDCVATFEKDEMPGDRTRLTATGSNHTLRHVFDGFL